MKKHLMITAAIFAANTAMAQDNVLHIYNWSDYIAEDTIEKFTAETGIEVTYDVYDSNEVLEAKLLAGSSGYDVVVPSSSFLQRQIAAGVFGVLDKSMLPNMSNMDPEIMRAAAVYDPGNDHAMVYLWGTTGIGYNTKAVSERLGADYVVNSWDLVFDPEISAKMADCGISFLDAPTELLPAAMNYLGLDPRSTSKSDLEAGAALLTSVRDNIRYYHSSQYISDLANGDTCVAVGWSGDVFQAQARAAEAANGVEIAYIIPDEGALQWFDMLAVPADAPNPDAAHAFINFVMQAQITADITNYVWYANANAASLEFVDEAITSNPAIFPNSETSAGLWASQVYDARTDRTINRLWTTVKTGQ